MILKFNMFVESRSQKITTWRTLPFRKQVIKAIETYAPWYDIDCELPLLRNTDSEDEIALIKPKEHIRKPLHSLPFYNQLIDEWQGFPKRSESIIGLTNMSNFLYGRMCYRVIPLKENAKIAVSPDTDIWHSFNMSDIYEYLNCDRVKNINGFQMWLSSFAYPGKSTYELEGKNLQLSDLKKSLENFKEYNEEIYISEEKYNEFIEKYPGGLFEMFEKIVSPENSSKSESKFEIIEYNNSTPENLSKREFWTDEPCLLVEDHLIRTL